MNIEQTNVDTSQETLLPKLDSLGRAYATGKRKDSIARVWLKPGKGLIVVNGKDYKDYFTRSTSQAALLAPLTQTDSTTHFDIMVTVSGGGLSGQAGAIRHGISKALTYFDIAFRPKLKPHGFLTRDSRVVESKKYGRKKARRSFQFSKR